MEIYIERKDDSFTSDQLKECLENAYSWDKSIVLEIRQERLQGLKTVDPTVLVAICSGASVIFGSLVTGILQIIQKSSKEEIELETSEGLIIKIKAKNAMAKLEEVIKLTNVINLRKIKL